MASIFCGGRAPRIGDGCGFAVRGDAGSEGAGCGQGARHQFRPLWCSLPLFHGIDKGYFKEAGLEIEIVKVATGAASVSAVASAQADIGWAAATVPIFARSNGVPVKMFMTADQEGPPDHYGTFITASGQVRHHHVRRPQGQDRDDQCLRHRRRARDPRPPAACRRDLGRRQEGGRSLPADAGGARARQRRRRGDHLSDAGRDHGQQGDRRQGAGPRQSEPQRHPGRSPRAATSPPTTWLAKNEKAGARLRPRLSSARRRRSRPIPSCVSIW